MVSKSCGSYWKTLDSNQQTQLLDKYITWSVGTYAERFKEHTGQRFEIVSSESVRGKYIRVVSDLVKAGKKTRKFSYMLTNGKDSWRIVDIQVEGVSQLSLTRAQFKSVLKDQGFEGLLEVLNAKISKLNQERTD
jgi:phospholipid transport system substrate-binding protein